MKHVATIAFRHDLRLLTPVELERAADVISMVAVDMRKADGLTMVKVEVEVEAEA